MKTETKVMISVVVACLVILVAGSYFYSKNLAPSGDIDAANPALIGKGDNVIKAPNEKATLVEFGDFECPACAAGAPYVDQLREQYKDSVTFVWRTFPLHPNSILASRAAFIVKELSNDPNKFFEMGDLLFQKQSEWATESGAKNQAELFAGYAASLGVDATKFKEILATDKYTDQVKLDQQDAHTLGTAVTPSFYVDGKLVQGADINTLKTLIDQKIDK